MRPGSSLATGHLLCGKWRILRVLGKGGMATVYEASHRNGKRVAIKVLHAELRSNAQARARFLREGYIANRVDHANVPSVLDDGETSDRDAFLVMDLLHGETLESRSKAGQISPQEVLHVALAILDVLSGAHEKGIVHRDVKPSNVFLSADGSVKLLDFGIARMREAMPEQDSLNLSRCGFALGTPSFMPPEQARGDWEEVDARTDIWSVGALMFALLTGRNVHQGKTTDELMTLSATTPAPALGSLRPDLPADIAHAVDRALSFHRERRWPDARAMHGAIQTLHQKFERVESGADTRASFGERTSSTSDQLSAVVEVSPKVTVEGSRKAPRAGAFPLVAATLLSSAAIAWVVSSEAVHAAQQATHAVSSSSSERVPEARSRVTAPPPELTDVPRPSSSNHVIVPPVVVDTARKSRVPSTAKIHPLTVPGPAAADSARSSSSLEPPAPNSALGASDADAWLERQK